MEMDLLQKPPPPDKKIFKPKLLIALDTKADLQAGSKKGCVKFYIKLQVPCNMISFHNCLQAIVLHVTRL